MDNLKKIVGTKPLILPKTFVLGEFIDFYIAESFRAAKSEPLVDSFDAIIWASLSEKLGISKEAIERIHRPLHWTFFTERIDSPFEYVQPTTPDNQGSYVRLRRPESEKDCLLLKNHVLKEYGPHLKYLVKTLQQANP